MSVSGKNASFVFGATTYDADDCLQSWALADAINEVVYQCNGYDKGVAGTRSITFNVSLALAAADTAKVSALAPGTSATFTAYPAGNTATYQKVTSTAALLVSANRSTGPNAFISIDCSFRLNDITLGAAT